VEVLEHAPQPVRISVKQAQIGDEMYPCWLGGSLPTLSCIAHSVGYGRQEGYLSVRIHSFTIYRRSRNPRPAKIAGIAFSIRAVRVPDCFAPAK
jgi:hypothetical protein